MEKDPSREEDRRISMKLLLKLVDDCSFKVRDDGKYEMQIDFVYENEFDIRDFLLKHQKID